MPKPSSGTDPGPPQAWSAGLRGLRWPIIGLLGSLVLRYAVSDFKSADYLFFLSNWYDSLLQHGIWGAIGLRAELLPGYCYPPTYLYLLSLSAHTPLPKIFAIKLISVIGDYTAAFYVWRILRFHCHSAYVCWSGVIIFLFLPTVVMTSSLWGQCDSLYTCCLLASLFYILKKRQIASLIAFGLACTFKPQAMFWGPFIAILLASRRVRWKHLWIPLAVYVSSALPAMLAGRPILDALIHWLSDDGLKPSTLVWGASNWYQWVPLKQSNDLWALGVLLTLTATALLVLWMGTGPRGRLTESRWLISCSLLSVCLAPFLLPGVRERYFYPGDVLSLLYAFYIPKQWVVPVLIEFASAFSYVQFLFHVEPIPAWVLALVLACAILLVIVYLVVDSTLVNKPRQGLC